jgi:Cu(I)/Ag(I) efflux system periplasmic protein CusF
MKKTAIAAGLGFAMAMTAAYAQHGRPKVDGVVIEVDQTAGTITLDHDEIPNLKMAPMIMAWAVKDAGMLKGLKDGDKVKFEAEEVDGQPKVVEIEKAK